MIPTFFGHSFPLAGFLGGITFSEQCHNFSGSRLCVELVSSSFPNPFIPYVPRDGEHITTVFNLTVNSDFAVARFVDTRPVQCLSLLHVFKVVWGYLDFSDQSCQKLF
jgi:hypothetical protein